MNILPFVEIWFLDDLMNFTFFVSRRRRKMYCGHVRLCVCPRPYAHITARTRM